MPRIDAGINVTQKEKEEFFDTTEKLKVKVPEFIRDGLKDKVIKGKIELLGLEMEKDLVVSTAHITKEDDEYFHRLKRKKFKLCPTVIVTDFEYGWIIYVPTDEDSYEETLDNIIEEKELSKGFIKLFKLAHELKCNHIRLDCDGPISNKLKQYDWLQE